MRPSFRDVCAALFFSVTLPARAALVAPAPDDVPIHIEDADVAAIYELVAADGRVTRCVGPCEMSAPSGRYRVRVAHGATVDEADLNLHAPMILRGEASDYSGVAYGLPLLVGGVLVGGVGVAAVAFRSATSCESCEGGARSGGGVTALGVLGVVLGVGGVVGGFVLIGSAHGSSLHIERGSAPFASLRFDVSPTLGGGAFAVSGSF